MSERSGGRLDEQASPAEPNPSGDEQESPAEPSTSGDSHRGALHRASTNGNSYREHHSTGSYRESQTTDSYWESDERPRNSPWALEQVAAIISECSPSQLEDVLRYLETDPRTVVWARMAADALQQLRVTGTYNAESQQSDDIRETDAPRAPDRTTAMDTSNNRGPSVNFRTGSELAYQRGLERGGLSEKAKGKQPKK
jgi:hypothetical protein